MKTRQTYYQQLDQETEEKRKAEAAEQAKMAAWAKAEIDREKGERDAEAKAKADAEERALKMQLKPGWMSNHPQATEADFEHLWPYIKAEHIDQALNAAVERKRAAYGNRF